MSDIPQDSMLRRHYLTEWRNNLDKQLLNGLCNQEQEINIDTTHVPSIWSNDVLIPLIAFAFFMAVIFI